MEDSSQSDMELASGERNTVVDEMKFDLRRNRFPYCIVWAPLPLITWLVPFIGHMGIADSEGRVHDFQGPYYVGVDHFMVGRVTKVYQFPASTTIKGPGATRKQIWDNAVHKADGEYAQTIHNICCNNCHHHAASALRSMGLNYSMLGAWWLITTRGRYVSCGAFLCTYLPFLVILGIILFISIYVPSKA